MAMEGHGFTAMEGLMIVVIIIIIIIIIIIEFTRCTYMYMENTSELTPTVEGVLGPLFCWPFLLRKVLWHTCR
jgi:hypothetical protein